MQSLKKQKGNFIMKKVKIGVLGAYRGTSMINYCKTSKNAQLVAICDKWEEGLQKQKELLKDDSITYYNNFEDFTIWMLSYLLIMLTNMLRLQSAA